MNKLFINIFSFKVDFEGLTQSSIATAVSCLFWQCPTAFKSKIDIYIYILKKKSIGICVIRDALARYSWIFADAKIVYKVIE